MENKKKLSLISGAALAVFASGVAHAANLNRTIDLSQGVLVAESETTETKKEVKEEKHEVKEEKKEGEKSCGGEKGCSHEKKEVKEVKEVKKHHKAK